MSYHVTTADPGEQHHLAFLDHLQARNTHAIGFLPMQALADALERRRVLLAWENGEPAGYMIHGKIGPTTRILQTVVADDARRIKHATALVEALTLLVPDTVGQQISLHCAEDLEANQFWLSLGFTPQGRRLRNRHRTRWQIRYERELPGKALQAMLKSKKIEAAGLGNLHRLLTKGSAQVGAMSFSRPRNHPHTIELDQQPQTERG